MEIHFKFNIGDVVVPVVIAERCYREIREGVPFTIPEGCRVTMRLAEECVSGTQLSYRVSPWNGGLHAHAGDALIAVNAVYDKIFELRLEKGVK